MQLHWSLARLILTSISEVPAVNNAQFIFKFKAFVTDTAVVSRIILIFKKHTGNPRIFMRAKTF